MIVDKQSCLQIVNRRGSCACYAALDDENNYSGRAVRAKGYDIETSPSNIIAVIVIVVAAGGRYVRRRECTRTVDGFVSRSPHFSVQHIPTSPRSPRTLPSGTWTRAMK